MSSKPPPAPPDLYALVPSRDGSRVAVVTVEGKVSLPPLHPEARHFSDGESIVPKLRSFGIDGFLQRAILFADSTRDGVCVFENRTSGDGVNVKWTDASKAASTLPEQQAAAVRSWIAETRGGASLDFRPPWTANGWFDDVEAWIAGRVKEAGASVVEVRQDKVWGISVLLEVKTTDASLWFKAVPPMFATEPVVTAWMARLFPGSVPGVVAIDEDRAWLLMRPFSGVYLADDASGWEPSIDAVAAIHLGSTGPSEQIPAHVRVRSVSELAGLFERSLDSEVVTTTCDESLLAGLRGKTDEVRQSADVLREGPVAECLIHGDLHGGNVVVDDGSPVIFDWSDAAVTHPFFDLLTCFRGGPPHGPPVEAAPQLLSRYLSHWDSAASMSVLESLWEAATVAGSAFHFLSYAYILSEQDVQTRRELAGGLVGWGKKVVSGW